DRKRGEAARALTLADGVGAHRSSAAPAGPSSARAPRSGRPSARALTLADGVWGHRSSAAPAGREQRTGPQEWEAERESAHAGRRGLGASEERSARRARAAHGPPGVLIDGRGASLYGSDVDTLAMALATVGG